MAEAAARTVYTTWADVGAEVDTGLLTSYQPEGDGITIPYQISTPEALAWFMYKVNNDDAFVSRNATMTANINLYGRKYSNVADDVTDINQALPWKPIGYYYQAYGDTDVVSREYKGIFDGGGFEIENMLIVTSETECGGMFGLLGGSAA